MMDLMKNILFNDVHLTHIIKDHIERRNLLPSRHGLLFLISSKVSFMCFISKTEQFIPWSLLQQLCSTGLNDK